jgi:hypothetical protein
MARCARTSGPAGRRRPGRVRRAQIWSGTSGRGQGCRGHPSQTPMAGAAKLAGAVTRTHRPVRPSPAASVTGRQPPTRAPMSSPGWSARVTGLAATRAQRTRATMPGAGALPEPCCPSALTARRDEPSGGPMTAAARSRPRRTCAGHAPMPMAPRATMPTGPAAGLSPAATPCGTRFRRALRPMAQDGRGPTPDARVRGRCTARGCDATTSLAGGRTPPRGWRHATGRSGLVPPSARSGRYLRQVGDRCLRQVGVRCLQGLSGQLLRIDPGRPSPSGAPCPHRLVPGRHGPSRSAPDQRSRPKPGRCSALVASGLNLARIFRWRSSHGCARR